MLQNYLNKMNEAQNKQKWQEALDYALILEAELDPHFITNASEGYLKILEKICYFCEKLKKLNLCVDMARKLLYYKNESLTALLCLIAHTKDYNQIFYYLEKAKSLAQKILNGGGAKPKRNRTNFSLSFALR